MKFDFLIVHKRGFKMLNKLKQIDQWDDELIDQVQEIYDNLSDEQIEFVNIAIDNMSKLTRSSIKQSFIERIKGTNDSSIAQDLFNVHDQIEQLWLGLGQQFYSLRVRNKLSFYYKSYVLAQELKAVYQKKRTISSLKKMKSLFNKEMAKGFMI